MPTAQARYWILTIPRDDWEPCLPSSAVWCIGQPEIGESSYRHWQLLVAFSSKKTLAQCKQSFCSTAHCEPTRSVAAEAYVRKDESRDGEPFEFGRKPFHRNSATDWAVVKDLAKSNQLEEIAPDIYIRYYRTLRAIASDFARPQPMVRTTNVFWGATGTGKSRRAWADAGDFAYCKDPRSKFWCGYAGQEKVIIDEFRGGIDIAHLLRWIDRYPVNVEIKGSSVPLAATSFWITSNLHPTDWYPELDRDTVNAMLRRLIIEKFE